MSLEADCGLRGLGHAWTRHRHNGPAIRVKRGKTMTTMYRFTRKAALLAAATPFVLLSAGVAAAQTTPAPVPPAA